MGLATVGCGGGDGDAEARLPLVGELRAAVGALEEELGDAPPQYYEIRATPLAVTLWVSVDEGRRAIPYVYADDELAEAGATQEVTSGFTFAAADALTFDPEVVLDRVAEDLDDSTIAQFSIVGTDDGPARLSAITESERGGRLEIRVAPDGEPLEATELD